MAPAEDGVNAPCARGSAARSLGAWRPIMNAAALAELAKLKQGARATWAAGDFPAIAQPAVGRRTADRRGRRGRLRRRRARRRLRHRQRSVEGGAGRGDGDRRRPDAGALRRRPEAGGGRRRRDRMGAGRRRGASRSTTRASTSSSQRSGACSLRVTRSLRTSSPGCCGPAAAWASPRGRPTVRWARFSRRWARTCRRRRRSRSRRCCGVASAR